MNEPKNQLVRLADEVRRACLDAALDAHEDGGIQGLCGQGRWELVVQRLRSLEVEAIVGAWVDTGGAHPGLDAEEPS